MKIYKIFNLKNKLKITFFFIAIVLLLVFSKQNFESVKLSTSLFINNILPSLFPFIFFSELILNSDIIDLLSNSFGSFISKLYKLNKNCTLAIIIGFLCGYPMGSKTVTSLYESNKITKNEAIKLLSFVNNCNPVFILSTIGISILDNLKLGIILLISHYLSAIIISIYITRIKSSSIIHDSFILSNNFNKNNAKTIQKKSFFDIIKDSLPKSFYTLLNIFGFIIIFNLLSNIFKIVFLKLNISKDLITIITSLFEITNGCNEICTLNITKTLAVCIISFLLGFSGLCILFQIFSTIKYNLFSFKNLVIYKTIQGSISFILTYILIKLAKPYFTIDLTVFSNNDFINLSYFDFVNNLKVTYINSIFIIIFGLCIFHIIYTFSKK